MIVAISREFTTWTAQSENSHQPSVTTITPPVQMNTKQITTYMYTNGSKILREDTKGLLTCRQSHSCPQPLYIQIKNNKI